ncbi:Ras GTPase-activating protein gap-2 [Toxocara canis]|uniref:Ras GTPase-activating protein gap-2 n=1 Tax=Toxocara canis TaxID=6265 RepID=A0A0B2UNG2_TOXCA|nr:Ras GTPase-activating protein gap-2 [Toxocara canis]
MFRLNKTSLFHQWFSSYSLNVIPEEGHLGVRYETCFESVDDGTESLDRRGWQQRALARGGHNGSTHNLMSMSAINGPTAFYQEGPGVAIVDGPTTPQRLANFFVRPFRTNPLKRTKSVSKLDRKRTSNDPD